jgi:predicted ester cyclase
VSSSDSHTDVAAGNKAVVERLVDAWNRGDIAGLMSFWSPEMVHHGRDGSVAAASVGSEMTRFLSAFPDLKFELQQVIAEGDLVSTRILMRATHSGPYLDTEPTGRPVTCLLMGQLRIVDGVVTEHWGVADGLHLLEQLGLVPTGLLDATA